MTDEKPVSQLRNLGPRSTAWLNAVGIFTRSDLENIGVVVAFQMIREYGFAPTLNLLYALEGAISDMHWTQIPGSRKNELRRSVRSTKTQQLGKSHSIQQRDG